MHSARKIMLYFNTLRHLKPIQILHRLTFKTCRPKPDFSTAPPFSGLKAEVPFPKMPVTLSSENRFRFLNEEYAFSSWNEPARDKLWLYNLHYFDWLRQPGISEEEGNRWIAQWITENPAPAGNGWEPYTLSLRIVNWIKWDVSRHALSDEAKHSLAVQVRFLMKRLEYHLLANHLIANAKALVFAGLFFSGPEAGKWLSKGLAIYREQLPEQILADGGHFELSPMYHSIILEDLLDLKNIHAPLDLDDYIARMLHWLAVMTGPDGHIALFNDAAHGIALDPDVIQNYGETLGFEKEIITTSADLPQSGYSRLQKGSLVCICDTGDIGPWYQPGHVHADALSFELWKDGRKILTNCGTGRYYDSPERKFQRSSAAHNTLTVDGESSSEVWSAHRVARRGKLLERLFQEDRCSGTFRTWEGIICTRTWQFGTDDSFIVGDVISGSGTHDLNVAFHPLVPDMKIHADPEMPRLEIPSVHSPEFGIFESKKTILFEEKNKLPFQIKFEIA